MTLPAHRMAPTRNAGLEMARSIRDVGRDKVSASEKERTLNKEIVEAL